MVKTICWKSIGIVLAGILIIVALFLFSAYMADQDMKEFNRASRGYDNFMVGVNWRIFFFFAVLVAFAFVGLMMSITGGVLYAILVKALFNRKAPG